MDKDFSNLNLLPYESLAKEMKKLKQNLKNKTQELDLCRFELEQIKKYAMSKGVDEVDNCQIMKMDFGSTSINKDSYKNF